MLIKRPAGLTAEGILFYLCLAFAVGIILFGGSFPTLDGPSHTYNAQLTNYIINGNDFIKRYFSISPKPSPNYTDHYLLALLLKLVSFEWAGKVLQLIYAVAFPVMFRKLVAYISPASIGMSILAIPYSFTILYYLGFYNFCLSFPILLGIILVYQKHIIKAGNNVPAKQYIKLCLLTVLLYFTNGLSFLYAGLILGLFEAKNIYLLIKEQTEFVPRKIIMRRVLMFIAIWVPGLVMFVVFMMTTPLIAEGDHHNFFQLLMDVFQSRILMVYSGREYGCVRWISYAVGIAVIGAMIYALNNKPALKLSDSIVFLFVAVLSIVLYFIVPDSASVGMMSIRLSIFFFVFFLLWLAMQKNYSIVIWTASLVAICAHFVLVFNYRIPVEGDLETRSELIKATGDYIQPNSVVLDIDISGNWLYGHFGDYLAADKPLVIVPNYEADYGWFGVLWKRNMPRVMYNGQDHIDSLYNLPGPLNYKTTKEIDYVFIHGEMSQIAKEPKWAALKEGLQTRYIQAYASADSSIHLYQLKEISSELLPK